MPTETLDLLSTAEVAERSGVATKTVLRWVAAGKLTPAQKMPGRTGAYLFDRRDVEALTPEPSEAAS